LPRERKKKRIQTKAKENFQTEERALIVLKTVAEYREHAEECRRMAQSIASPEHKAALMTMAKTWEGLALEREKRITREAERGS
jgi:hypothetical protein